MKAGSLKFLVSWNPQVTRFFFRTSSLVSMLVQVVPRGLAFLGSGYGGAVRESHLGLWSFALALLYVCACLESCKVPQNISVSLYTPLVSICGPDCSLVGLHFEAHCVESYFEAYIIVSLGRSIWFGPSDNLDCLQLLGLGCRLPRLPW
jgi:hypothetical protein